jgi:hypothetical protein
MRRDIQVDDAPSVVGQHDEHKQNAEGRCRNREEVDRGELGNVVGEEGTPRLRRRTTATAKARRPGGLRYLDSQLLQLAVDARRAQSRFASRIWRIKTRRSEGSAGRPTRRGREFHRQ